MSKRPFSTTMRAKLYLPLAVAAACVLSAWTASGAAFIKFDGVDGEATDAGHRGWSDLESVDMGVSKEIDPATGEPTGKVKVDRFCFTKRIDKSSPLLMGAAVDAEKVFPTVTIEFTREPGPDGGGCKLYLKYELQNVVVTSHKTNVDRNNPPGTEEICLSFGTLTVTYIPCNPDGTSGDPVTTTYTRN